MQNTQVELFLRELVSLPSVMLWSYEEQTVISQNKFHLLCCQHKI